MRWLRLGAAFFVFRLFVFSKAFAFLIISHAMFACGWSRRSSFGWAPSRTRGSAASVVKLFVYLKDLVVLGVSLFFSRAVFAYDVSRTR